MKIRIERWTSSEQREEIHVFIEGTQTYLFGYNPNYVSFDMAQAIVNQIMWDDDAKNSQTV